MSAKLAPLTSSAKQDWQTPDHVLDLVRQLDDEERIALDVATSPDNPCKAEHYYHEQLDGLDGHLDWGVPAGRVLWMNPPYNALRVWAAHWADAARDNMGGHLVALTPSRTDTAWFAEMRAASDAICFVKGRLTFIGAPSCAPFPSAIFYAGPRPGLFEDVFQGLGWVVRL